ncbi:hypothetical protein DCC81_11955 [Chitinophaga parva]|uniref:Uncharacterized protein n=1 Tax=Chitinophaga parva TaxID=2169414 RepID=A0A2T7BFF6_9BACT|nr:hypothetical protein [Chitinophaga parva]PUZ25021.1 hypothetical protein DCC81_11955 [Chitinophaga parva]
MAPKKNTNTSDAAPEQGSNEPLMPASATPAPDPVKDEIGSYKLAYGEILLASLKPDGSEGIPFKVSTSTYQQYYQDTTKFVIKKNA